jgi:hypothetical protein
MIKNLDDILYHQYYTRIVQYNEVILFISGKIEGVHMYEN